MRSGMLPVDGAELYYEVRGTGPALLLIVGAGGDGGLIAGLAENLANAFTVINYDRRGNSRSTGRGGATMTLTQQASDAKALIDEFAGGKALVFGNSGGAIIGLTLAAQHPEVVRGLIAHEPPAVKALPEGDPERDFFEKMGELVDKEGPQAAGAAFAEFVRGEGTYAWDEEVQKRFLGNLKHLFITEWPGFTGFVPDYDALSKAEFPIVLAAGAEDRGLNYARPSIEIAKKIGASWAEFPGIHMEFNRDAALFGAGLRTLLTEMHSRTADVPDQWKYEG
ncbi:alpha/beta hydrolase [Streptomyces violaceusniger]|uniref:Alpha/beta hydrolase n=1 Tax=Streptomyces violaceusniger TaxID=68280 RepID=A0A4D4LQC5_STRVO|nr:alpha/beta hydrolase [Streptomyces violaceusniger]